MNLGLLLQTLQGFVASFSCLIIAIFVLFSSKEKASRWFVALSISIGIWCLGPPIINFIIEKRIALEMQRLFYIFGILIIPIFLHFVLEITGTRLNRNIRNIFYVSFGFIFYFCQSDLFIANLKLHGGLWQTSPGPIYLFFVFIFAVTIYVCLFILYQSIKKEENKTKKCQLKLTLYAYIISYGAGFFYFLTIYEMIPIWTQAGYFVYVSNLILFYAISHYKLLSCEKEFNGKICEFKSNHLNGTMELAKNLIEIKEKEILAKHAVRLISRAVNPKSVSFFVREEEGFVKLAQIGESEVNAIDCKQFKNLIEEKKEPIDYDSIQRWASETKLRNIVVSSSYMKDVLQAALIIPVVYDSVIGFFAIGLKKNFSTYTKDEMTNLMLISYATSITLKNIILNSRVIRDKLTGLFNIVYFDEQIETEIERVKREQKNFILAFLDIDHFKRINDGYGHSKGNEILKAISKAMNETLRPSDILCRWGGEEFAIIMRDTDINMSYNIAERLRSYVEKNVSIDGKVITVSIGVAECRANPDSDTQIEKLQLLELADSSLYKAKNNGRNQICIHKRNGKE